MLPLHTPPHQKGAETQVEGIQDKLIHKALEPKDSTCVSLFITERFRAAPLQIVVKLPLHDDLNCSGAPDVSEFLGLMQL